MIQLTLAINRPSQLPWRSVRLSCLLTSIRAVRHRTKASRSEERSNEPKEYDWRRPHDNNNIDNDEELDSPLQGVARISDFKSDPSCEAHTFPGGWWEENKVTIIHVKQQPLYHSSAIPEVFQSDPRCMLLSSQVRHLGIPIPLGQKGGATPLPNLAGLVAGQPPLVHSLQDKPTTWILSKRQQCFSFTYITTTNCCYTIRHCRSILKSPVSRSNALFCLYGRNL